MSCSDRFIGVGIAWHEGQLFAWVSQRVGVLTAAALFTLAVSGFLMWRQRKPDNSLGAAPQARDPARLKAAAAIMLVLATFLPLPAGSLILLWVVEQLILPRLPRLADWLGVRQPRCQRHRPMAAW